MSHQRISVSTLVTLLVAVVTMGSIFAPARPAQSGRRPSLRVSRTTQRPDAAEAASHDTDHQDPARAVVARSIMERAVVQAAPDRARRTSWVPRSRVVSAAAGVLVAPDRGTSQNILITTAHLPLRVDEAVTGRAPPAA